MSTAIHQMIISNVNDNQKQIELYNHISSLEQEYPNFKKWYFNTVLPDISIGLRKIIIASNEDHVAGVLILKDKYEKKICTLRVAQEYRGNGLGRMLMNVAFQELRTTHPLITVSDNHFDEYLKLFRDYDFKFTGLYYERYIRNHSELAFNGHLVG